MICQIFVGILQIAELAGLARGIIAAKWKYADARARLI
jgi:hypothetical protein